MSEETTSHSIPAQGAGSPKTVVVLSFETLPACSLGCYGEWNISTPQFDALADRSLVFEHYYLSSNQSPLAVQFGAQAPARGRIRTSINSPNDPREPAGHSLLISAWTLPSQDELREFRQEIAADLPALLWIDVETNSPNDSTSIQAGNESLAWQESLQEHSVDVEACDQILGEWLEVLEGLLQPEDIVVVTSSSGDPRRIHDDRPEWWSSVSEPVCHVPLIVHHVEAEQSYRIKTFLGTADVAKRLSDTFHLSDKEWLDFCSRISNDEIRYESALAKVHRNREWMLIESVLTGPTPESGSAEPGNLRLFHKPEDLWEVHDVSSQWPQLIETWQSTGVLESNRPSDAEQSG